MLMPSVLDGLLMDILENVVNYYSQDFARLLVFLVIAAMDRSNSLSDIKYRFETGFLLINEESLQSRYL